MRYRKVVPKVICGFTGLSVCAALILALKSSNWFLECWGGIEFQTVVYQLSSPMKGTSSEILDEYCVQCIYPTIYITLVFFVVYCVLGGLLKKTHIFLRIAVKCLMLGGGFLGILILIRRNVIEMGIPEYFEDIRNTSSIFEIEYVDPRDVEIEFPKIKRNLLLIYLESMETTYASRDEGGGKNVNLIPELTELAKDNVYFSNTEMLGGARVYAGTEWTMAGLLSSVTGVPYKLGIEGNSAGKYESFLPGIISLGDILLLEGYQNYFMCGSDASFAGRDLFYMQHGSYEILDYISALETGFIPEGYREFWGMEDEKLYDYAKQKLEEISEGDQPFNFTMLTVDTHHPDGYICQLCENEFSSQYANALVCASRQLGDFIDWVKRQSWYENTTIVLMGDHLSMNNNFWDDIGDYGRRTYNCFINVPDRVSPYKSVNREFSTMDMFPTILAAINADIEGDRLGLGTNLYSGEQTLPEKMGWDVFEQEIKLYSKYYYSNFIIHNR